MVSNMALYMVLFELIYMVIQTRLELFFAVGLALAGYKRQLTLRSILVACLSLRLVIVLRLLL